MTHHTDKTETIEGRPCRLQRRAFRGREGGRGFGWYVTDLATGTRWADCSATRATALDAAARLIREHYPAR
jgi:hypothetical protein